MKDQSECQGGASKRRALTKPSTSLAGGKKYLEAVLVDVFRRDIAVKVATTYEKGDTLVFGGVKIIKCKRALSDYVFLAVLLADEDPDKLWCRRQFLIPTDAVRYAVTMVGELLLLKCEQLPPLVGALINAKPSGKKRSSTSRKGGDKSMRCD